LPRANVDSSVGSRTPVPGDVSDSNDQPKGRAKEAFSGYSALEMEDAGGNEEDPEEDFGGLMVSYLVLRLSFNRFPSDVHSKS
jgi:hypothetical protein